MNVKEQLFLQCKDYVANRLKTVQEIIADNQNALASETKSSAGDKHETGRAMLQLEMEKAGQQLAGITQMQELLSKIEVFKKSNIVHLGSVVFTSKDNYFLAISAGKLTVFNNDFYAISMASPIGKLLLGKKESSEVVFNGEIIKIQEIQ